ncbi:MAG: helix-turn-helix transcriptional regulator [Actinobacteria bacterium]|nr:helix-turn-helix transcriptional regulator [Actinomycetota bacterium]
MREFVRGAVRLHILHHAAEGPVHGAWLSRELAEHGYDISPGKLYPTLHQMEAEGLVTSEPQTMNGKARRVYRISPRGNEALQEGRRAVRRLADELLGTGQAPLGES